MPREVVFQIWCDICIQGDEGVRSPGTELPQIAVGNRKARVPALCDLHKKELYDPFMDVFEAATEVEKLTSTTLPRSPRPARPRDSSASGREPVDLGNGYFLPRGVSLQRADEYKVRCPVEGCVILQKNAHQAANHLRTDHGMSLFDAIGKDGVLYDITGMPVDTPKPRAKRKPAGEDKRLKQHDDVSA